MNTDFDKEKMAEKAKEKKVQLQKEKEMVLANLASGNYVAHKPNDKKLSSPCYVFMHQVYKNDGTIVDHWYKCTDCNFAIKIDVSNGTKPLLRHAEKHDPNLRDKKLKPNQKNPTSTSTTDESIGLVRDIVESFRVSDDANGSIVPNATNVFSIKPMDLAESYAKATEIGCLFGFVDKASFERILPKPGCEWYVIGNSSRFF